LQIQESTKTRISFRGEAQKDDEDRVLLIRGTQDAVHQAELMVRRVIVDQPPVVSDSITVPGTCIGCIIGELYLQFTVLKKVERLFRRSLMSPGSYLMTFLFAWYEHTEHIR